MAKDIHLTLKPKIKIMEQLIAVVVIVVVAILAIRLFGAWMLRINTVISELRNIADEVNELRNDLANYQEAFLGDMAEDKNK